MVNVHKYRYSQRAGALNEAAVGGLERRALAPPAPTANRAKVPLRAPESHAGAGEVAQTFGGGNHGAPDWAYATSPGTVPVLLEQTSSQSMEQTFGGPSNAGPAWASHTSVGAAASPVGGLDPTATRSQVGMFHYTVEEGQQALMISKEGKIEVIVGPKRVWRGSRRFERMLHYVAHPSEFLIIRFRDGRQEHLQGPANIWFDPRIHLEITKEDALQIAAKEAVVVYCHDEGGQISRRIVNGPEVFVPRPGEWLHTFRWHGSKQTDKGYHKIPGGLVFQKLWLMPDQMYHDVTDVRTADDAVLTIRLMIFFELTDIDRMLNTTHDPIGDFVNAATSDVVDFTGRYDFDSFKQNTDKLNDSGTYKQLLARAQQCGYRINKIVYRGYGAPDSLQRMHDEAIESRTRLQLERATQQQAQELEDFKQERHLVRAERLRQEETAQAEHGLTLSQKRRHAELQMEEQQREFSRKQGQLDGAQARAQAQAKDALIREHLAALRGLGVDLTQLLTQGRADQVIELRGSATPHLHLPPSGTSDP